nr:hypothetical protein [Tanacetum cinerariifolium]
MLTAATFEVLPRLNEIKFISGVIDERWCLDTKLGILLTTPQGVSSSAINCSLAKSMSQLRSDESNVSDALATVLKLLKRVHSNVQQIIDEVQRLWKCRLYAFENKHTRLTREGNANTDKRPIASLNNRWKKVTVFVSGMKEKQQVNRFGKEWDSLLAMELNTAKEKNSAVIIHVYAIKVTTALRFEQWMNEKKIKKHETEISETIGKMDR